MFASNIFFNKILYIHIFLVKGKTMYVIFAASMSLYIAKTLWENMQLIIMQYREWVMWYVLVTSLISFVICYRFGPVTNTRTKQIIEWFLQVMCHLIVYVLFFKFIFNCFMFIQLVGLALIYHSSHFHEASFSCCIIVILFYNFPKTAFGRAKRYW